MYLRLELSKTINIELVNNTADEKKQHQKEGNKGDGQHDGGKWDQSCPLEELQKIHHAHVQQF